MLTQLIGPVCAAESITSAKKAGMSLADWVSEAVSLTTKHSADHLVMFVVGNRHCQVPIPAWLWLEFQRGVCWDAPPGGAIVPKTTWSDEERIALERIVDRDVDGEDYAAPLRMESALEKALFLLDVLKKVYADDEQKSRLHDQRVSGLIHLSAGLDAELMICLDLMLERIKQLELQRGALRQLSGRKLGARDFQQLNQDEDLQLARRFARRNAGEGQVAA